MGWIKATVLLLVFFLVQGISCLGWSAPRSDEIALDRAKVYAHEIAANPKDAHAFYNRGTTYLTVGRYIEALEDFDRATALNPSLMDAQINRGVAYLRLGRLKAAEQAYAVLIDNGVQTAAVYANRGAVYLYRGDYGRALADYSKAATLEPENAAVHIGLGIAYAGGGDRKKAAAEFQQATVLDTYCMEAFYNLGVYDLQEDSAALRAQALLPLAYAEYLNTERADKRADGAILYRLGEAATAARASDRVVTYFDAAAQLGFQPLSLNVCARYMPALVERPLLQPAHGGIMRMEVQGCYGGFVVEQRESQATAVWQGQESLWPPEKWQAFQEELQQLPVADWYSYYGDNYTYRDRGFSCNLGRRSPVWKLQIMYGDGTVLNTGGYFMKPSGFARFEKLLNKYFVAQEGAQGGE